MSESIICIPNTFVGYLLIGFVMMCVLYFIFSVCMFYVYYTSVPCCSDQNILDYPINQHTSSRVVPYPSNSIDPISISKPFEPDPNIKYNWNVYTPKTVADELDEQMANQFYGHLPF